ncbi:MAG: DUF29 domain-containing protein [Bryobacteraceae bacterium]|nr:DUF29 domain-containing protein [Bryobacteraceae bacterium]
MPVATPIKTSVSAELYKLDFAAWADATSKMLLQGRFDEIGIEQLVEEVQALGDSVRSEAANRYAVLVAHILKWRHQPTRRKGGWQATIVEQQRALRRLLKRNPSVIRMVRDEWPEIWDDGRAMALAETRLAASTIPSPPDLDPLECLEIELPWED